MRVIIATNTSWSAYNFRLNLISALSDRGHDVFVLAREDEYTERLRGLGVSVIPLNYKLNLIAIISDITKILRVIKAQDVDAVFSFTHICNLTFGTASFFSRFRFYPNIAGLGRAFSSGANPALRFLITKLYRCCLLRVDKVFFQNADDCAWAVKENLVDLNITVSLPGSGVDLKKFPPVSALELHKNKYVTLTCRLMPQKGVDDFIKVAESFLGRDDIEFILIGGFDSSAGQAFKKRVFDANKNGVIKVIAHTDDIRKYLIRTKVFFFPSYYREGTPRSVLEALATGLPVVTTDTPGCRDCVIKGENGYLCDPKDHESFAGAISQIFGMDLERYSELSKASTLLVSLTFDENIVIDKILSEMNPQA